MDDSSSKSLVMNKGVVSIASSSEGVKPVTHNVQLAKEADLGISEFVSPNISGFSGILKKRSAMYYLQLKFIVDIQK